MGLGVYIRIYPVNNISDFDTKFQILDQVRKQGINITSRLLIWNSIFCRVSFKDIRILQAAGNGTSR